MIYLGSDHAGFELKEKVKGWLKKWGYEYQDVGPHACDPNDDYPDWALEVALRVKEGGRGILICGTGLGMAIAANKVPGIRATDCWNEATARGAREHNDANILCLGARCIDEETAQKVVKTWLETPFSNAERHARRIAKIAEIEKRFYK